MKKLLIFGVALLTSLNMLAIDDNTVEIVYDGTTATITIADNITNYVNVTSGTASDVVINQTNTDDISADNDEIIYRLSGTSSAGSLYMTGSYKCTVELNDLTLTNPDSAAISIINGKRIKVKALTGTTNTLTDGSAGNAGQKGCLYVKGHLELRGYGTLNVVGNVKHAIKSGEYMSVANITVNVTSAVKDGMNCNEYFLMESGTVNLSGIAGDGIQSDIDASSGVATEASDDAHTDEDTGNFYQTGGDLTISLTSSSEGDLIKVAGTESHTGGTYNGTSYSTGISSIQNNTEMGTEQVYDLSGRQVKNSLSGLHIIKKNGKTYKAIIK